MASKATKTPSKTPAKSKPAVKKAPAQERSLRTPAHGKGQLMTGGTNKGGPGRPPNAYKVWLEGSLNHPAAKGQVTKVLRNNLHPAYASVLGKVMVNVLGIPGRAADADPGDGPSAVIIDL